MIRKVAGLCLLFGVSRAEETLLGSGDHDDWMHQLNLNP